jgi:hypothetical protein
MKDRAIDNVQNCDSYKHFQLLRLALSKELNRVSPSSTWRRKQIQFPKRCFFQLCRIPDDGQSPQTAIQSMRLFVDNLRYHIWINVLYLIISVSLCLGCSLIRNSAKFRVRFLLPSSGMKRMVEQYLRMPHCRVFSNFSSFSIHEYTYHPILRDNRRWNIVSVCVMFNQPT